MKPESPMSTYQLRIEIKPDDVKAINDTGLVIVMVKSFAIQLLPIWATVAPFEENTVEWSEDYGLFAMPGKALEGVVLSTSSIQYPAELGVIYPFAFNIFGTPTGGGDDPRAFSVQNNDPDEPSLVFGLCQTVVVDSGTIAKSPVCSFDMPSNTQFDILPRNLVTVFLGKKLATGTLINVAKNTPLEVDMEGTPTRTIHFDGVKAQFEIGPLPT
jgi:hypothetical protein